MTSPVKKMHRTLLFAPGSRIELLTKAQLGAADAMIFDLEDSVPLNAKDEARKNVQQALALGLKKIGQTVEHEATSNILGMVNKVSHLVKVEELA